jgi:pheromone shutdown protein TraB
MKCNGNHSGHSNTVLTFGIIYIVLFMIDIATGAIMVVYGAWYITAGGISAFGGSLTKSIGSSLTSVQTASCSS